jgi:hypothetical protein
LMLQPLAVCPHSHDMSYLEYIEGLMILISSVLCIT